MGYFSCNSDSSVIACDPYNQGKKKKHKQSNIRRFSYSELESATNGFSPESFLGKGSHGRVYKAVIDDHRKLTVAVKKINMRSLPCNVSVTDNEIEILSKVQDPHFVNLLGFSLDYKLIVVEYMENGSLYELLHVNPRPPGWAKRVRFGLHVAKAVAALHTLNPPVIHRDIKSSNVLIDGEWNARLGDFGLALRGHVEDMKIKCTPPAGTLGYLDPLYVAPENLSAKSDVFSFGILLLEILSGRNALDVNYSPPSVLEWAVPLIKHGEFVAICDPRIDLPEDLLVIQELALVAARCVRSNAEKRLSMVEVVECLRVSYKRVCSPIWNSLRRHMRKQTMPIDVRGISSVHLSHWNRRLSSVQPSEVFEKKVRSRGGERIRRRSNSIGSVCEIRGRNDLGLDRIGSVRKKAGLVIRMPVKLNRSRSLGVMRSKDLVYDEEEGFVV